MITIITGTPGAGKTLHAIEKLLLPLVGTTIKVPDGQGGETEVPRTIYTNINGLLIEHELVETGGEWIATGNTWEFKGNEASARNWHQWAKPGSVIVIDEFQKMWPPRANGAKVPPDVQTLDTHRHMGVDFVLITQSVMNTDRHIHALGGRHLHVRRVANMQLAVVYEWDHVSRSLMYSKAITKSPWRYSRKVFKLYRSAEVHTKQPRKMPGLVWFVLLAIGIIGYLSPGVVDRIGERINPTKTEVAHAQSKTAPGQGQAVAQPQAAMAAPADKTAVVASTPAPVDNAPAAPAFAGCVMSAKACKCFDVQGQPLDREPEACKAMTSPPRIVLAGGSIPDTEAANVPEPARFQPPAPQPAGLVDLRRAVVQVAANASRH